jgi:hypothetical protein
MINESSSKFCISSKKKGYKIEALGLPDCAQLKNILLVMFFRSLSFGCSYREWADSYGQASFIGTG